MVKEINWSVHSQFKDAQREGLKKHRSKKSRKMALTTESYSTIEECLEAVRKDGLNLEYIKEENQTEEVCLAAIRNDPSSIRFIKKQTPKLCGEAIKVGLYEWDYITLKYDGKDTIGTAYKRDENIERDTFCPICFDEWCEEDEITKCPCCKHHYHMKCVDNWIHSSITKLCPYCKSHKWINYLSSLVWFEDDPEHTVYELGSTPTTIKGTIFEEYSKD